MNEPVDPGLHRALSGRSRVRVLQVLRDEGGPLTVPDVSTRVGLHPNTVRAHLDQLVAVGLATSQRERRDRPGRPRQQYTATPVPDAAGGTQAYRELAQILVGSLEQATPHPASHAARAGREWGGALADREPAPATQPATGTETEADRHGVGQVVALLDELGFDPVAAANGTTIDLRNCPFGQRADDYSAAVCALHLGLMQGALAQLDGGVRVARLDPFVTPQVCRAELESA